eukprot:9178259-Lingulodinium_polyedra.AAC.1
MAMRCEPSSRPLCTTHPTDGRGHPARCPLEIHDAKGRSVRTALFECGMVQAFSTAAWPAPPSPRCSQLLWTSLSRLRRQWPIAAFQNEGRRSGACRPHF